MWAGEKRKQSKGDDEDKDTLLILVHSNEAAS